MTNTSAFYGRVSPLCHSMIVVLALTTLLSLNLHAQASPIYNQPADLTGSRAENNGIITYGPYAADNRTFTLSWNITPITNGYHYAYTFSGYKKALSHIILDLSDDCTATSGCIINPQFNGDHTEYKTFGPAPSNPYFPPTATITGLKFDDLGNNIPFTVEFDSARRPVWGDFYTKDGKDPRTGLFAVAYNRGLGYESSSTDPLDFITRPDGEITPNPPPATTPEPSTILLVGSGLTTISLLARKKLVTYLRSHHQKHRT